MVSAVTVALNIVPGVGVQVVPDVKTVGAPQRLLAGCAIKKTGTLKKKKIMSTFFEIVRIKPGKIFFISRVHQIGL